MLIFDHLRPLPRPPPPPPPHPWLPPPPPAPGAPGMDEKDLLPCFLEAVWTVTTLDIETTTKAWPLGGGEGVGSARLSQSCSRSVEVKIGGTGMEDGVPMESVGAPAPTGSIQRPWKRRFMGSGWSS